MGHFHLRLKDIMIMDKFRLMSFSFQDWLITLQVMSYLECMSVFLSSSPFYTNPRYFKCNGFSQQDRWMSGENVSICPYFVRVVMLMAPMYLQKLSVNSSKQISPFLSFVTSVPLHYPFLSWPSQLPSVCPFDLWWVCSSRGHAVAGGPLPGPQLLCIRVASHLTLKVF